MKTTAALKKRLFEELKASGFRKENVLIVNQQTTLMRSLSLNYAEFVDLMHLLQDEGYCTIGSDRGHEVYKLTAKVEEEY